MFIFLVSQFLVFKLRLDFHCERFYFSKVFFQFLLLVLTQNVVKAVKYEISFVGKSECA